MLFRSHASPVDQSCLQRKLVLDRVFSVKLRQIRTPNLLGDVCEPTIAAVAGSAFARPEQGRSGAVQGLRACRVVE
jgi:hypothetical protein